MKSARHIALMLEEGRRRRASEELEAFDRNPFRFMWENDMQSEVKVILLFTAAAFIILGIGTILQ